MESLQNLNNRLKGVQNIGQITKAMELTAATKMRRSQEIALNSRPYVFAALDLLATMARLADVPMPALLAPRAHEKGTHVKTAYVVVTSDKGLAGSFNNAVLRTFEKFLRANPVSREEDACIGIGQKAAAYIEKNLPVREKFVRVGDYTTVEEVEPIASFLTKGYLDGAWDRVVAFSTHFRSALRQDVLVREIMPVTFEKLRASAEQIVPETGKYHIPLFHQPSDKELPEYLIEPSPAAILEGLAGHLMLMEIYHLILEANASEHAARRMAMKNASDNAKELSEKLGIEYNKSRQAAITREIIEIVAGAESLK